MNTYMFLLYNGPTDFDGFGPEDMQGIIERYTAWEDSLKDRGRFVAGDKLVDEEGRVLRRTDGELRILDGPFSETKEVIGGYFAVTAESYDDALELAKECPHVEFGTLEIRRIDAMH